MRNRMENKMNTKSQRRIAASVCAVLILVILLSTAYVLKEYNHDCTGADCIICFQLEQAAVSMNKTGVSSHSDTASSFVILLFTGFITVVFSCLHEKSLVTWNIRLDE